MSRPGEERGSAAVEFALVLPLILVLALVLVEVGLLAKDQLVLANAARAGAREAAVTIDDARVRDAVGRAAIGLDAAAIEVSIDREPSAGSGVTVTVRYVHRVVLPAVRWLLPDSVSLASSMVMRQEAG